MEKVWEFEGRQIWKRSVYRDENINYGKAVKLWMRYYFNCEEYDRKVCTGFSHFGFEPCAIPQTPEERRLINENARREYEILRSESEFISENDLRSAKRDAGHYRHDQLKEILGY